jgi:hypothetical protein
MRVYPHRAGWKVSLITVGIEPAMLCTQVNITSKFDVMYSGEYNIKNIIFTWVHNIKTHIKNIIRLVERYLNHNNNSRPASTQAALETFELCFRQQVLVYLRLNLDKLICNLVCWMTTSSNVNTILKFRLKLKSYQSLSSNPEGVKRMSLST